MATPIGHGLAGYAVYLSGRTGKPPRAILWLCLLMSIAPDLDFIPGILQGQPNLYHQGVSHSLGAALVASFAAAVFFSGGSFWRQWTLFGCAYVSHLVLDFLGPDGRLPYGQPLFWPISGEYYFAPASLQLLWGVHHAKATSAATSDWISGILQPRNLGAISIEVLVTLPFVLLAQWYPPSKVAAAKTDFQQKYEAPP